jgi:prophage regulatory protein
LIYPVFRRLNATARRREKLSCAPATAFPVWTSSSQKQPTGGSAAMREPDRIIRLKTVLARTGLSRSTIYRKIAEGTFPAQLKISTNGTGWHESDINRWIADPVSWRPKREFDEVR